MSNPFGFPPPLKRECLHQTSSDEVEVAMLELIQLFEIDPDAALELADEISAVLADQRRWHGVLDEAIPAATL